MIGRRAGHRRTSLDHGRASDRTRSAASWIDNPAAWASGRYARPGHRCTTPAFRSRLVRRPRGLRLCRSRATRLRRIRGENQRAGRSYRAQSRLYQWFENRRHLPQRGSWQHVPMTGHLLRCTICHTDVDPEGPAVAEFATGSPLWIPFVEDLRTSAAQLAHPRCFADAHGIDARLGAVRRNDEARRGK